MINERECRRDFFPFVCYLDAVIFRHLFRAISAVSDDELEPPS